MLVVLVRIGVNATRLANGKLGDFLRGLLAILVLRLWHELQVHEDRVAGPLVVGFRVVVTRGRVAAEAQESLQADVQTVLVFWSEEALEALIFVDELASQVLVDLIDPAWAGHRLFSHDLSIYLMCC